MNSNIEKYRADFSHLLKFGNDLLHNVSSIYFSETYEPAIRKKYKTEAEIIAFKKGLPSFQDSYHDWYSEASVFIKQILPDRLTDFVKHYQRPAHRTEITIDNYCIEDGLLSLRFLNSHGKIIIGEREMVLRFKQQFDILKSAKRRFESSLFEIKQLLQADLFDSELDAARELLKKGFIRAAGAISGVVLEKHLRQVCESHSLLISKKNPTIADFNEILKSNTIIEIPAWRHIQLMADLRNLADHNKNKEPTIEEMSDLVEGVMKITKSVY